MQPEVCHDRTHLEVAKPRVWSDQHSVKCRLRIAQMFTVTVMMAAWFAISNHCALGATPPQTAPNAPAADGCPFHAKHSNPAKPKPSSDLPCCKILRAVVAKPARNLARPAFDLVVSDLVFHEFTVFVPARIPFVSLSQDTGPPGVRSFAELILQRSILAHAPPHLV
jgi:hypothetical protein